MLEVSKFGPEVEKNSEKWAKWAKCNFTLSYFA